MNFSFPWIIPLQCDFISSLASTRLNTLCLFVVCVITKSELWLQKVEFPVSHIKLISKQYITPQNVNFINSSPRHYWGGRYEIDSTKHLHWGKDLFRTKFLFLLCVCFLLALLWFLFLIFFSFNWNSPNTLHFSLPNVLYFFLPGLASCNVPECFSHFS